MEGGTLSPPREGKHELHLGAAWVERTNNDNMRIAIPVTQGKLSMHFGHCEQFALIDVDFKRKEIISSELVDAPPHQPGLLPVWLKDKGARMVIASGMGRRAQARFQEHGIEVLIGADSDDPDAIVKAYLDGVLTTGENICDH